MENNSFYPKKLIFFNNLFNRSLPCKHGGKIETSEKFVFQLVLEMCKDTSLQQKVLTKLEYYTSFTQAYLSGVQFKPKNFNSIIKTYEMFVTERLNKYSEEDSNEAILEGFIVNFSFSDDAESWEPSDIWASKVKLTSTGDVKKIGFAGAVKEFGFARSLYNYDDIIMNSIVGAETVKEHGIDGFLALLIIFIHEDLMLETKEIEPLGVLCLKELVKVDKFNKMCGRKFCDIWLNRCHESFLNDLVLELEPKKKIGKWIEIFTEISHVPDEIIQSAAMYMTNELQTVLFKKIVQKDEVTTYQTNYDDIIDNVSENVDMLGLDVYIKEIFKIITITQWLDFLTKISELDEINMMSIFISIDTVFRYVFFGLFDQDFCGNVICKLKIESTKRLCFVKGKYYDDTMSIRHPDGCGSNIMTWNYDKNLNQLGYTIDVYVNNVLIKTEKFKPNHKKIIEKVEPNHEKK